MAVPKRRTSRSNTRHRRSQWKATTPDLVPVTLEGRRHLVPRALVPATAGVCCRRPPGGTEETPYRGPRAARGTA